MLQKLRIEHLVLVDSCELTLDTGFQVITGETGSGKSALLTAIGLLLGEKADVSSVRNGEKMAVIEGDFHLSSASVQQLIDIGLDISGHTCTLRREILSSGKSRAFIDGQLVPIGELKRLGSLFVEISSQHACLELKESSTPRLLLDRYGTIDADVVAFTEEYKGFLEHTQRQKNLLAEENSRETEMERLQTQLNEITSSGAGSVDDEALFNRLQTYENAREIFDAASALLAELGGGRQPIQAALFRVTQKAEKLLALDSSWDGAVELLRSACASTKEASNELNRRLSSIDHSEEDRMRIESQLKRLDDVKRRYGPSNDEVIAAKEALQKRLSLLEGREDELNLLEIQIKDSQDRCDTLAKHLSCKRRTAATKLQAAVQKRLRNLHMDQVVFEVEVEPTSRSSSGNDAVHLFFTPNVGEKRLDIAEGASGGELARVYLAVQAVMAEQYTVPTILFDEIDASIGGMTANAVGETLAAIGQTRQVLAVTHFPQVASKAQTQFAIAKEVHGGRTVTFIRELSTPEERRREYQRMAGTSM